ncbi:MAG: F0F1 ATP synthase subunit epsilon [Clostridia bacterium]|nr:F0F1 ATP synthase subunit epsilon [Clostridia bacterium]
MNPFPFRILTPTSGYFEGEIVSLVFPTEEGYIGILRGRSDCIISVKAGGVIRYVLPSGEEVRLVSEGGAAEVKGGVVTYCTEEAYLESESAEVSERRAREREEEGMLQARNREEYTMYKVAMAKAFDKLKRSSHNNK